jgi:hypothetical protein
MTDEEFLLRFEHAALSRQEWNHTAHLRMAYLYLKEAGSWQSVLPVVRERIREFNAAHRNYSGYHETITVAFLRLIDNRINGPEIEQFASFDAFSIHNPDLFEGISILLRHYEKATLLTPEARAEFVEPDREPLP